MFTNILCTLRIKLLAMLPTHRFSICVESLIPVLGSGS